MKDTQKYYCSFGRYIKERYGESVRKVSIDAGFTCPNRDGTKARGGCIYCDNRSFSPNSVGPLKSVKAQIENGMNFYKSRFDTQKFIIYFQAYTNTYAPIEHLKKIYDQVLEFPDVVAISIGTRPDCVSEDVLDLLEGYTDKFDVWLELGLQSMHNSTLQLINRAHSYEDFGDAVIRVRKRRFLICAHTIFGLPGESWDMMMRTVDKVAGLKIDSIKIHHLYVAKDTQLEQMYYKGMIKLFTLDEWISLCADILERLPPTMVVQRLMGELSGEYLIAPRWQKSKDEIIKLIETELRRRGSYQGRFYSKDNAISSISLA